MKTILIVDDASTVRQYHRSVLEEAGYAIDEAANGIEGVEKALQHAYDLYLVDVNMPKMDGYSFLREIRRRSEIHQAPAVMVSTEAQERDKQKAYASGANFYLVKPTRPAELVGVASLMMGA